MARRREAEALQQAAVGFVDLHAEVRASRPCRRRRACRRWRASSRRPPSAAGRSAVRPARPRGACCRRRSRACRFGDDAAGGHVRCALAVELELVLFVAPCVCRARRLSNSLGRSIPVGCADAEFAALSLDDVAVAVGALADFEEVGVGGDLQRFARGRRRRSRLCRRCRIPACRTWMHEPRAEPFAGRDHAGFERRHRGDRLERRAGRIGAVDGAVGQRTAARCRCRSVLRIRLGQRFGELVRVEARSGADREDLPVARVHRHERARVAPVCRPRGRVPSLRSSAFSASFCRPRSSVSLRLCPAGGGVGARSLGTGSLRR